MNYLLNKKQPLKILEAGCGNGWLCHRLAEIPGAQVIGTDTNFTEIQQAARVFADVSNLHFIYSPIDGDTFEGTMNVASFGSFPIKGTKDPKK